MQRGISMEDELTLNYSQPVKFKCSGNVKYHYGFLCRMCAKIIPIEVEEGLHGDLGSFICTSCNTEYYATIDDKSLPQVHIFRDGALITDLNELNGRE